MKKFELGRVVMTRGIADRMEKDTAFSVFVALSLGSYSNGNWGNLDEEAKRSNDDAIKNGDRIVAEYLYEEINEKIWIITEWDRSVTTILFPWEY